MLSNPFIDACWQGAKTAAELDGAIEALDRGKMDEEELAWMRRVGVTVRARTLRQDAGRAVADRLMNWMSGFGLRSTSQLPRGS